MKILGICGSHRKKENTFKALKEALKASKANTEIIHISDMDLEPCRACYDVCSLNPYTCVIEDDLHTMFKKMAAADGIILASPLYSPVLVPSRLAVLMERLSCIHFFESLRHEGNNKGEAPLSGILCGIIAVSGGSDPAGLLKLLANFVLMLHLELVTVKDYPYFGVWVKSPVEEDVKGLTCAQGLGELLAVKGTGSPVKR